VVKAQCTTKASGTRLTSVPSVPHLLTARTSNTSHTIREHLVLEVIRCDDSDRTEVTVYISVMLFVLM